MIKQTTFNFPFLSTVSNKLIYKFPYHNSLVGNDKYIVKFEAFDAADITGIPGAEGINPANVNANVFKKTTVSLKNADTNRFDIYEVPLIAFQRSSTFYNVPTIVAPYKINWLDSYLHIASVADISGDENWLFRIDYADTIEDFMMTA